MLCNIYKGSYARSQAEGDWTFLTGQPCVVEAGVDDDSKRLRLASLEAECDSNKGQGGGSIPSQLLQRDLAGIPGRPKGWWR